MFDLRPLILKLCLCAQLGGGIFALSPGEQAFVDQSLVNGQYEKALSLMFSDETIELNLNFVKDFLVVLNNSRFVIDQNSNSINVKNYYSVGLDKLRSAIDKSLRDFPKSIDLLISVSDFEFKMLDINSNSEPDISIDRCIKFSESILTNGFEMKSLFVRLGQLYLLRNDISRAQSYLRAALSSNAQNTHTIFLYGMSLYLQDNFSEAISFLEQASRASNPEQAEARTILCKSYIELKKMTEALKIAVGLNNDDIGIDAVIGSLVQLGLESKNRQAIVQILNLSFNKLEKRYFNEVFPYFQNNDQSDLFLSTAKSVRKKIQKSNPSIALEIAVKEITILKDQNKKSDLESIFKECEDFIKDQDIDYSILSDYRYLYNDLVDL